MDWLHCHVCYRSLYTGPGSADHTAQTLPCCLGTCGHVFCNSCMTDGGSGVLCSICGVEKAFKKVREFGKDPDVDVYLRDASEITSKLDLVLKFQAMQRKHIWTHLLLKVKELEDEKAMEAVKRNTIKSKNLTLQEENHNLRVESQQQQLENQSLQLQLQQQQLENQSLQQQLQQQQQLLDQLQQYCAQVQDRHCAVAAVKSESVLDTSFDRAAAGGHTGSSTMFDFTGQGLNHCKSGAFVMNPISSAQKTQMRFSSLIGEMEKKKKSHDRDLRSERDDFNQSVIAERFSLYEQVEQQSKLQIEDLAKNLKESQQLLEASNREVDSMRQKLTDEEKQVSGLERSLAESETKLKEAMTIVERKENKINTLKCELRRMISEALARKENISCSVPKQVSEQNSVKTPKDGALKDFVRNANDGPVKVVRMTNESPVKVVRNAVEAPPVQIVKCKLTPVHSSFGKKVQGNSCAKSTVESLSKRRFCESNNFFHQPRKTFRRD